jgi:hypothetical protein
MTISGAKIAIATSTRMMIPEIIATLSRRRRRQKSCRGESAEISPPWSGSSASSAAGMGSMPLTVTLAEPVDGRQRRQAERG